MGSVADPWAGSTRRHAAVLIWLPGILVGPLLDLPAGTGGVLGGVALVLVMAAAAVTAVVGSHPRPSVRGRVALTVLAAAVVGGAALGQGGWLPTWLLLALATPAFLRGWWLIAALGAEALGAVLAASGAGLGNGSLGFPAFAVVVAGAATTAFLRLMDIVEELRRTREELARAAVAQERERFSRDLHDLLGHTLSLMVVKAEAVRRLAHRDPDAVADHARDIEQVGRRALVEVREAVDGLRHTTLTEEIERARRALEDGGVRTTVQAPGAALPEDRDQVLAWVVREAATNVLRHAGASRCRIAVTRTDSGVRLEVRDDGTGGPVQAPGDRVGGLDGLRHRLDALGGSLEAGPGPDGFRLNAALPLPAQPTEPATAEAVGR